MIKLHQQIGNLERLLKKKGYYAFFTCNSKHLAVLSESVTRHLIEHWRPDAKIEPFNLTICLDFKKIEDPYLRFDFQINHNRDEGFGISKMNIQLINGSCTIKNIEYNVKRSADIPNLNKAKTLLSKPQEKKKIKGLKL